MSIDSQRFRPRAAHSLGTLFSCLLLFYASSARASGFAVPAFAPTNSGVSTTGPTSVHFNPAGLGFARRLRIMVGGELLIGSIRYERVRRATYQRSDSLDYQLPIEASAVDPNKSGAEEEVQTNPIGLVPSIFIESPIGKQLAIGFGVDVPYAAIVRWPGGGPQRFQLDDATLATVFINAGIAYRPTKRVSFGAGISYVVGFASLTRTQDLATVQELGDALGRLNQANGFGPSADPALRELDTFARPFTFENGWAHGVTFRAGIMAEPVDDLWLSASYEHTTQLDFRGSFTLDMNNPFFTQDLTSQGLDYPAVVRGDASLSFTLPRVVRAGIRYAFGKRVGREPASSVAVEGTYTGWSSVEDFDVRLRSEGLAQPALGLGNTLGIKLPRAWRDTYGGLARFTHSPHDELTLWLAGGGESAAVPDTTIDAASPDGARVTASGGLSRVLVGRLRLLLDLTYQHVLSREVASSDYDLGNGNYKMFLVSAGAYLDFAF